MTLAIGAITVVFSKLSRLEVRKASCCAIWRRIDSAAAVFIRTRALAWSSQWSLRKLRIPPPGR